METFDPEPFGTLSNNDRDLAYYNGPLVYTHQTPDGKMFLVYFADETVLSQPEFDENHKCIKYGSCRLSYLVRPITEEMLETLLSKKVTIRDFLLQTQLYLCEFQEDGTLKAWTISPEEADQYIPDQGVYLDVSA